MEHYSSVFVISGSPYYYSATSRGAGPTATATASAYDRHWPPPTESSGGWREEEQGRRGKREGWIAPAQLIMNRLTHGRQWGWRLQAKCQWSLNFLRLTYQQMHCCTQLTCRGPTLMCGRGHCQLPIRCLGEDGEEENLDHPIIYQGLEPFLFLPNQTARCFTERFQWSCD